MGSGAGGKKREIHLLVVLNHGGARTAKKDPLGSVTENLMGAVKHALGSCEHIVALQGETNLPSCSRPPSPAGGGANGICGIPAGNGNAPGQKGPEQLLGHRALVAEMGVAIPAVPVPGTHTGSSVPSLLPSAGLG